MITYNEIFINGSNTFQFKRELAMAIGRDEAIVVNQIEYWLSVFRQQNDRERHLRDGRWWVWNTMNAWVDQFGIYSYNTLSAIFNKLKKNGILITSTDYNRESFDRTLWYSIDYERLEAIYTEYWKGKDVNQSQKSKKVQCAKAADVKVQNGGFPIAQNLGNAPPKNWGDNTKDYNTNTTTVNIDDKLNIKKGNKKAVSLKAESSPSQASDTLSDFDISLKKTLSNMRRAVSDDDDFATMKYVTEYFFSAVAIRTCIVHHVLNQKQCDDIYITLRNHFGTVSGNVDGIISQIQCYIHDFAHRINTLTMEHFATDGILEIGDHRMQSLDADEDIDYRACYIGKHPGCLMDRERKTNQVLASAT